MAANERPSNLHEQATHELVENGQEIYGWRVVDGRPRLVVVGIAFTIQAQPHEDFEEFRRRMIRFAGRLARLEYPATRLAFHRREAQRKLPWAEFDCATPETGLPRVKG